MSNFFAELELKFFNFETKIEKKIEKVKNVFNDESKLLDEKFSIDHLNEKHSNGLNSCRQELLNKVSFNLRLENGSSKRSTS